jgi:hypothetical protein
MLSLMSRRYETIHLIIVSVEIDSCSMTSSIFPSRCIQSTFNWYFHDNFLQFD